jgi:Protein of unknown function (DUF4239)
MNIVLAAIVIAVVSAAAIAVMLFVRRRAPEGSYFSDGDRASGVFGVLATGFSVLLGFLIFLAFESYDESRTGAETEAVTVAQQIETAQLLPSETSAELTSQLICYGRAVVHDEWERMEQGTLGNEINPWGAALFETLEEIEPSTASEEAAFGKWLDQTADREVARQDRIHGAVGIIPVPLWVVLFFIAGIIFVYLLFFADSAERAVTQAVLMGSVVAVITAMLLLLNFLDNPVHDGIGGLQPVAMERALSIVDQELVVTGLDLAMPCDATGIAV